MYFPRVVFDEEKSFAVGELTFEGIFNLSKKYVNLYICIDSKSGQLRKKNSLSAIYENAKVRAKDPFAIVI